MLLLTLRGGRSGLGGVLGLGLPIGNLVCQLFLRFLRLGAFGFHLSVGMAKALLGGGALYLSHHQRPTRPPGEPSTLTLLRTYAVFAMCSVPALVDYSPTILDVLTRVPVVRHVTEAFVRRTFFDQVRPQSR